MDEEQTKYCEMENGCLFCDRLLCEGKKEEKSSNSKNGHIVEEFGNERRG